MIIWLLDWNDHLYGWQLCNAMLLVWSEWWWWRWLWPIAPSIAQVLHRWADFLLCVEAKVKLACKQFTMKWGILCLLAVFLLLNNFVGLQVRYKEMSLTLFSFRCFSLLFPVYRMKKCSWYFWKRVPQMKAHKNIKLKKKMRIEFRVLFCLHERFFIHQFDFLF